jgi:hypothetical protein
MSEPDANLTAAPAAINADVAHQASEPAATPDYEGIVYRIFNETCTNSPFFRGPAAADVVSQNFIPALIAALKKG